METALPSTSQPGFRRPSAKAAKSLKAAPAADPLRNLRLLVYLYAALWIFEGALRKWIVPSLSGPLLIIRDPILLMIYAEAIRQKVFRLNGFTTSIAIMGILATVISLGLPKSPPIQVIAFGFRANFLHLPLIFLIPHILKYKHVKWIGKYALWVAAPMAVLSTLQYLSTGDAYLNTGAGGAGGMLETARGHIRPSGTFSFTNGLTGFCGVVGALLLHQLLERQVFPRLAFFCAAPALLVMVVVSGSRTNFGLMALLLLTVVVIWVVKPRFVQSSLKFLALGFVVVAIVGSFSVLREGMATIAERFGDKHTVKTGFFMRFVDEFAKPLDTVARAEICGVGIGMGTNAASNLMYGTIKFNLGESDYDRVIMEMGPVQGLAYIAWRMLAALFLLQQSLQALRRDNNTLPLLLTTAVLPDLVLGQFGQSTTLGYACLASGLVLAACRRETEIPADELPAPGMAPSRQVPRRPPAAQQIHAEMTPAASDTSPPVTKPARRPARGRSAWSELQNAEEKSTRSKSDPAS